MDEHEFIAEEAVSSESLLKVFKRAFIKGEIDDDGDLAVFSDGFRTWIFIDAKRKYIKFLMQFSFKDEADAFGKIDLANTINSSYMLARFIASENVLRADYHISYEEGVLPYQIVASYRRFAELVPEAIRTCDKSDLIS
jgi:hypothetical protein